MNINYEKLGTKIGLEVHQQLDTKKLFIRTPSVLSDDTDFVVSRKLRPVASELGEFDKAAVDAFRRDETFFYEGNFENISLVEIDEEPPQPIDNDALETIIEISLLFDSDIVSEAVPMRKTVIDGSNTSAFQRTMLLSTGGKMKINSKEIGLETIVLEEDACKIIKRENGEVYYNLDRLGIPLIELATAPEMKNPEEAFLGAKKIGEIFRLTGKTKRGKGTIRQDVNISIKEGNRCEIKGCQDLELIPVIVEKEVERQLDLLEIKKELKEKEEKKFFEKRNLFGEVKDISKIFEKSDCKFAKGKQVFGLKFIGLKGMLGKKTGSRRFGSELSDYAKSSGVTGIMHYDEMPAYGISKEEVLKITKELSCKEKDNFIFIISSKEKSLTAFDSVKKRIITAFEKVPEETRKAEEDGSSSYQRPLSSSARMYPETDLETIKICEETIKKIRKNLPKSVEEREKYYSKLGLSSNQIREMKLSNNAVFFEELVKKGANPRVSANLLLQTITELKRENKDVEKIRKKDVEELLLAEKKGKIGKNSLKEALSEIISGKTFKEVLEKKVETTSGKEVEKIVKEIVQKNIKLVKEKGFGAVGPLMGDLMKEEKLKEVDGKALSDVLKREILKNK